MKRFLLYLIFYSFHLTIFSAPKPGPAVPELVNYSTLGIGFWVTYYYRGGREVSTHHRLCPQEAFPISIKGQKLRGKGCLHSIRVILESAPFHNRRSTTFPGNTYYFLPGEEKRVIISEMDGLIRVQIND